MEDEERCREAIVMSGPQKADSLGCVRGRIMRHGMTTLQKIVARQGDSTGDWAMSCKVSELLGGSGSQRAGGTLATASQGQSKTGLVAERERLAARMGMRRRLNGRTAELDLGHGAWGEARRRGCCWGGVQANKERSSQHGAVVGMERHRGQRPQQEDSEETGGCRWWVQLRASVWAPQRERRLAGEM